MKKILKIEVEIEGKSQQNLRGKFEAYQMIFTDYETLFDYDAIAAAVKKAMLKLGGFEMLTMQLTVQNENEYPITVKNIKRSHRYVTRGHIEADKYVDGIEKADMTADGSYQVWNVKDKKDIFESLRYMVDQGNRTFIELLKVAAEQKNENV